MYTDPLNSSNVIGTGNLCGGYMLDNLEVVPYLLLDGAPADLSPKGYICPVNQVCEVSETGDNCAMC